MLRILKFQFLQPTNTTNNIKCFTAAIQPQKKKIKFEANGKKLYLTENFVNCVFDFENTTIFFFLGFEFV